MKINNQSSTSLEVFAISVYSSVLLTYSIRPNASSSKRNNTANPLNWFNDVFSFQKVSNITTSVPIMSNNKVSDSVKKPLRKIKGTKGEKAPKGDKVYQEIRKLVQVQEQEKRKNWEKGGYSEKHYVKIIHPKSF